MPETSNISDASSGGSIDVKALASIVLPLPGAPIISALCSPLAAIDRALLATYCHLTCAKSCSCTTVLSDTKICLAFVMLFSSGPHVK